MAFVLCTLCFEPDLRRLEIPFGYEILRTVTEGSNKAQSTKLKVQSTKYKLDNRPIQHDMRGAYRQLQLQLQIQVHQSRPY